MQALPEKNRRGTWLQTERAAHEAWGALIDKSPKAAKLMHLLTARIGDHNAVVVSVPNLTRLMKCSRPTVLRALKVLRDDRWIEVRQIGGSGTTNAYIINNRVAWHGARDGIRYGLFSANVLISDDEQPDRDELDKQEPLRDIPALRQGEHPLPSGPGLEPPSQAFLDRMEPDLPATGSPNNTTEDDELNAIADKRQNDPVVKVKRDDL